MNTLLKKGAFIVALFSIFSSFAMELEQPEPEDLEQVPEQFLRADLGYTEDLAIVNPTSAPIFINIFTVDGQLSTQLSAKNLGVLNITDLWADNLDPATASTHPEVFFVTLSKAAGGAPFGTICFLMNNDETDLQVILLIGSFNKTYDFNVTGVGDLNFGIYLEDDSTKAPDNFEKTHFQLVERVTKENKIIRSSKIYSKEEKKSAIEHFTKELELPRFKNERLGRPEIRIEQERLLKKLESKQPTIDELLKLQRK